MWNKSVITVFSFIIYKLLPLLLLLLQILLLLQLHLQVLHLASITTAAAAATTTTTTTTTITITTTITSDAGTRILQISLLLQQDNAFKWLKSQNTDAVSGM